MYEINQSQAFSDKQLHSQGKKFKINKEKLIKFLPYIVLIALAAMTAFLGYSYYDLKKGYDPQTAEFKEITENIKTLINISEDEEVRVAKITDLEKLKEQNEQFYKDAKNGQYLVVLPESQRVLIYDTESKKIVNFSSYNIQVELIPEDQIEATEKPLTIEIRVDGQAEAGIGEGIKSGLEKLSTNYKVLAVNKTTNSYEGIKLILLKQAAKPKMSQNIIAHVGTNEIAEIMPENEANSSADVVIFIGADGKANGQ